MPVGVHYHVGPGWSADLPDGLPRSQQTTVHLTLPTRPSGSRTSAVLLAIAALLGGIFGAESAHAAQRGGWTSLLVGGGNTQSNARWQVRTANGTLAWISRIATPVETSPLLTPGRFALVLSVFVESTQTEEFFALQVPSTPPGVRRPLLVGFHGFNTSYADIVNFTTFFDEAAQRDWFIVTPFQVSTVGNPQISFASVQSQEHVEAVIAFLLQNYWIDRDRLYGVGFSMGGGNVLSYAARHRDRGMGAFAAVVNHTGSVALGDVHAHADPTVQAEMDLLFGGPPAQFPFEYQRSSLIELDAGGLLLQGGRHMGRNLVDVPIRNYYGIGDPNLYLVNQTIEFDAYMQTLPGSQSELFGVPVNPNCPHCWETIDETVVCDWLANQTLNPSSTNGAFLLDRSARWGPLDVETQAANSFGSLTYDIDVPTNTVSIFDTSNTDLIAFDAVERGLDPLSVVLLRLGAADGTGDRILIRGYAAPPSSVERNGVNLIQDPLCGNAPQAPTWCYDAAEGTVELNETGSALATWVVYP